MNEPARTTSKEVAESPATERSAAGDGRTKRKSRRWLIGSVAALCLLIAGIIVYSLTGREIVRQLVGYRGNPADSTDDSQPGESMASANHPLAAALELADTVLKNLQENVHDYTATVIKQERIGGQLKPEEICYVKIRSRPFSAYMKFVAPAELEGQEVIYVANANEGNLIAHPPPDTLLYKVAKKVPLPPASQMAMKGQRYPITELGIENLTRRLIEVGRHDEHYAETYVWRNDNAKVGDRPCISLTVMHPVKRTGFIFHIARIFVDRELMVPLHYEAYDWPEKESDPPVLLERYTYANLKLNPGLTDADFDPNNPEYQFVAK